MVSAVALQSLDITLPERGDETAPSTMTPSGERTASAPPGSEADRDSHSDATRSAPPPTGQARSRAERMDPSRRWAQAIAKAYDLPSHRAERLARPLLEAARAESVPMVLMAALVMAESSYRPFARSHAGAIGPAQVIPRWWADGLCRELDIADPAENLHCGARVLAHYREGCDGDWRCALRRYNVGPGALASGDPGAQAAARRYERKIAENLARFGLRPSL